MKKNIWNIAESNFGSDGGGINLHAECMTMQLSW